MRRVLVVLALVAATTAGVIGVAAPPSQAAFRAFSGLVDAGVPVPIDLGTHLRTAMQVIYRPDGSGVVYLHECGDPPQPGDTAMVVAFSGQPASNVALIPPSPGSCVTPTAPGLLIIDALDTFPLGNFTPLPGAPQQTIAIGPGATVEVDLPAAIPDEMVATMLIRGTGTSPSLVTVWTSGLPQPLEKAIGLSEGDGDVTAWATGSGTERRISLYNQAGTASVTLQFTGWYDFEVDGTGEMPLISWQPEEGAGFHQQVPTRLLDSRQTGARLAAGGVAALTFPDGQEAVALNVTLAEAGGEGFATAWPCAEPRPLASNLNFVPGDEVANAVIATTDDNGQVCFFASAPTDLIVDQSGWFGAGGDDYTPADPLRLLDTRVGIGASAPLGPFGPHAEQLALPLGSAVPAGATSAVFNLTVTEPEASGFAAAWPCGVPRPNASNVNYGVGETVPNLVTVPIGTGGSVCFFTSARAHLIADLQGWYSSDGEARYEPLVPTRWFDTRDEGPAPVINYNRVQPLYEQPDPSVRAAVVNTTVTEPAVAGFATVWPCTPPVLFAQLPPPPPGFPIPPQQLPPPLELPNASNLNFVAGQTVPNLVIGRLAPEYTGTCFYASQSTHLLADVSGLFVSGPVSAVAVGGNAYLGGGAALRAPLGNPGPGAFGAERSR